jgi:hypothetical protein
LGEGGEELGHRVPGTTDEGAVDLIGAACGELGPLGHGDEEDDKWVG